jgi:TPR repeat protein
MLIENALVRNCSESGALAGLCYIEGRGVKRDEARGI